MYKLYIATYTRQTRNVRSVNSIWKYFLGCFSL